VLDWAHVSSVAVGVENNYLVTLRNLNTVVSLRRDGDAALLWTLSSSLDSRSDFDFAREEEKFYQVRRARAFRLLRLGGRFAARAASVSRHHEAAAGG